MKLTPEEQLKMAAQAELRAWLHPDPEARKRLWETSAGFRRLAHIQTVPPKDGPKSKWWKMWLEYQEKNWARRPG